MTEVAAWDPVDDNNNATPPNGWPEGQMPSTVNNSARMMMGAVRREHDRVVGQIGSTPGTITAPTINTTTINTTALNTTAVNATGNVTVGGTLTTPVISFSPHPDTFALTWDGSSAAVWINGTPHELGDITSVTAGNGLTGGGSSGAVSLAMSGTYTGNFAATGDINAVGGVAGSYINSTGTLDCNYLHSRGNCDIVGYVAAAGTVQGAFVNSTGNISATSGSVSTVNVFATGQVTANAGFFGGQLGYYENAGNSVLQMHSGWYWQWLGASGDLIWGGPSGAEFWVQRFSDHYCGNQIGPVFGNGAYINFSDVRAKTDIQTAPQGLAEILQLVPITFKRVGEDRSELGFGAQDVREILPEAVHPVGVPLPDGSGAHDSADPSLGVSLDPIVAALVNAIKELTGRVKELETALVK